MRVLGRYRYEYDLGEEWLKMTGLPFVFAVWMSNKELSHSFESQFNDLLSSGLKRKAEVIDRYQHLNTDRFDVGRYLTRSISYELDSSKRKALDLFLSKL